MACGASRRRDDHSSCTPVARRIKQPTRTADPDRSGIAPAPFLFGLAPGGVCRAASVAGNAVRSYRTVSPLPRLNATRRGGLFSVALSLGFPPPDVIRHRWSMEPGLSSPAAFRHWRGAAVRPTDHKGMGAANRPVKLFPPQGYWPAPTVFSLLDFVGGPPGSCDMLLVRLVTSPLCTFSCVMDLLKVPPCSCAWDFAMPLRLF